MRRSWNIDVAGMRITVLPMRLTVIGILIVAVIALWLFLATRNKPLDDVTLSTTGGADPVPVKSPANAQIIQIDTQRDGLSVRETMGLVFVSKKESGMRHLFRRADPDALPMLRRVLTEPDLARWYPNVWDMLGYVGNGDDVVRVRRLLFRDLEGELSGWTDSSLHAAFRALGVMCRRDVPGAIALVDELERYDTWSRVKYRLTPAGVSYDLTEAQENLTYMLAGYALSNRPDVEDRCHRAIKGVVDKDTQTKFEKSLRLWIEQSKRSVEEEGRPVADDDRRLLDAAWNMDAEHPRPASPSVIAPKKPDASKSKTPVPEPLKKDDKLFKDAVAAYAEMCEFVRRDDAKTLGARLLDDAARIRPADLGTMIAELQKDLPRLRQILDDDSVVRAAPENATMTRDSRVPENVTIRYELSETKKLGIEVYRHGGFHTVAKNGNLVVLLKRIDGVWFWNPFGW